jgi:two-component system nitrogen regulation sensor histidine kinase GlnL
VILLLTSEVSTRVELIRDYDPSLPPVQGDADQLMQALLNLGRNAVQAVGDAGQVVFRTRAITGYLIGDQRHRLVMSVEIEDDGPGVPEELLESLFYPLVTSRPEGTGLGLPLAQDLVSRNGGLIEFESSPGRTIFLMRLPVEQ